MLYKVSPIICIVYDRNHYQNVACMVGDPNSGLQVCPLQQYLKAQFEAVGASLGE